MVPHLIKRPVFKQYARSSHQPDCLALHVQFDAAVRRFRQLFKLVDSEEIADPVAESVRDYAGVLPECFSGLSRLPAAVPVLQGLR